MNEKILILDFGSQYTQLIARRVRELNIYCEIFPFQNFPAPDENTRGIILSGSPFSVHDTNHPTVDFEKFIGKFPVLGVCYGAQLIAQKFGGSVVKSNKREYGRAILQHNETDDVLFKNVSTQTQVWMSHADTVAEIPSSFQLIAHTDSIPVAAYKNKNGSFAKPVYCLQFHPEVTHSTEGKTLLENFCVSICASPARMWVATQRNAAPARSSSMVMQ